MSHHNGLCSEEKSRVCVPAMLLLSCVMLDKLQNLLKSQNSPHSSKDSNINLRGLSRRPNETTCRNNELGAYFREVPKRLC